MIYIGTTMDTDTVKKVKRGGKRIPSLGKTLGRKPIPEGDRLSARWQVTLTQSLNDKLEKILIDVIATGEVKKTKPDGDGKTDFLRYIIESWIKEHYPDL